MAKRMINELQSLVSKLQAERQTHLDAVAAIDETFQALGISVEAKKRGRRPGARRKIRRRAAKKRTKRRTFKTTAVQLVLATIKKVGAKGATGGQITKAWKAAGRPGNPYNTLGLMVRDKKIKRRKVKGGRGSVYTAG